MAFITGYPLYVTAILFVCFSIPAIIIDCRTKHIPGMLVYMAYITMICYRFACTRDELLLYIGTALISVMIFVMIRISSKKALSVDDIKYSAFCGLYAGPVAVFCGYIIAAVICGIWYAIQRKRDKIKKDEHFPFAPFMAMGTFMVALLPIINTLLDKK